MLLFVPIRTAAVTLGFFYQATERFKQYNPLDFEYDDENFSKISIKMAQKFEERIDYCYVYRMNIVTIYIAKTNSK